MCVNTVTKLVCEPDFNFTFLGTFKITRITILSLNMGPRSQLATHMTVSEQYLQSSPAHAYEMDLPQR